MLGQKILPAILIMLPAIAATAYPTSLEATSQVCKAKPDTAPPTGRRWQYRINPADQHRCWFSSRNLSAPTRTRIASRRGRSFTNPDVNALTALRGEQVKQEAASAQGTKTEVVLGHQSPGSVDPQHSKELPTSDDLIPKKVATITYSVRPAEVTTPLGPLPEVKQAAAQDLPRVGGTDLMFLGGGLATALLVAGVVFQIIGRLRQVRLTHSRHEVSRYTGAVQHTVAQSVEELPAASLTRSKSFKHEPARSDPTNDLKSKMDQFIIDLQKSTTGVSSASFVSRAPRLKQRAHECVV